MIHHKEPVLILAAAVQFGFWADGMIRFVQDGYNLPRGPLGVLCYLPFIPVYWIIPPRHRSNYLWISSLVLALLTLGPAYAFTIAALALASWAIIRVCGLPRRLTAGALVMAAAYLALILHPQPGWLPPVDIPYYFYIHWAGIGYLFLRSYHVLADVAAGKLIAPGLRDFLAYLLFAPTLRMGPIYRYNQFAGQLADGPTRYRSFSQAGVRFVTGAIRLAVMSIMIDKFRPSQLYENPQTLGGLDLIISLQVPAMAFYLWISGYVDWSICIGRLMGFDIPDNFNYPWRSASIDEFWRRWHITLSLWLKDYLFIPLVRHRWHYFWSFTLTFLFCGLWHSKDLSFILCGLSQGIALSVRRWWDHLWRTQREKHTALYQTLSRARLVHSPLNTTLCWLVNYCFLMISLGLALDEKYTYLRVTLRLLSLVGIHFQ